MAGCRDSCRSNAHVLRRSKGLLQRACVTTSPENPHTLGGWNITLAVGEKLCIKWLDEDGASLGKAVYHLESVLEKWSGRQGKSLCLWRKICRKSWPFRCLLAMEPMPPQHGPPDRRPAEPPALPVCQPAKPACGPGDPETAQSHVVCHRLRWRWYFAGKGATLCVRCTACPCGQSCRRIKKGGLLHSPP